MAALNNTRYLYHHFLCFNQENIDTSIRFWGLYDIWYKSEIYLASHSSSICYIFDLTIWVKTKNTFNFSNTQKMTFKAPSCVFDLRLSSTFELRGIGAQWKSSTVQNFCCPVLSMKVIATSPSKFLWCHLLCSLLLCCCSGSPWQTNLCSLM